MRQTSGHFLKHMPIRPAKQMANTDLYCLKYWVPVLTNSVRTNTHLKRACFLSKALHLIIHWKRDPVRHFPSRKLLRSLLHRRVFCVPFAAVVACDSVVLNAHLSYLRRNHNVKLSCYFPTTAKPCGETIFHRNASKSGSLDEKIN